MHTRGLWIVEDDDSFQGCRFIPIDALGRVICEVRPDYDENRGAITEQDRANARLIAAAPELLLAVIELEARFGDVKCYPIDLARAAIAKATRP